MSCDPCCGTGWEALAPRDGCNLTDSDNPVPIELVPVRALETIFAADGTTVLWSQGQIIPAGDTSLSPSEGVAPDGSAFIASYYRDPATGATVDPATVVWSSDCSTPASGAVDLVEFVDPADPGAGLVRVWRSTSVAADGTITVTYTDSTGAVYDPAAEGTVDVDSADVEKAEVCYLDGDGVKQSLTEVSVDEFTGLYLNGVLTDVTGWTKVACNGEERPIPGCITIDTGEQVQGFQWTPYVDGTPVPADIRYTDTLLQTAATASDGATAVDLETATVTGFDPNGKCCPPGIKAVANV